MKHLSWIFSIKREPYKRIYKLFGIKFIRHKHFAQILDLAQQNKDEILKSLKEIRDENKIILNEIKKLKPGIVLSPKDVIDDFEVKIQTSIPNLLVYTYATEKYFPFAILYPLFILNSNKDVAIEIGIENYKKFMDKYGYLVKYYDEKYPNKVYFHPVKDKPECLPGTARFITQPLWKSKYVYIGDVDIMITEEIAEPHIRNIIDNKLDFSNIKRLNQDKLTGLHFIEYDKMYPIRIPKNISNLSKINDEMFLYRMMQSYGYKIPDENINTFRPLLGVHFSFWSRPPLVSLTTKDKPVPDVPYWFIYTSDETIKKYLEIRYSKPVVDFMGSIDAWDMELRRIVQLMDIACWYELENRNI